MIEFDVKALQKVSLDQLQALWRANIAAPVPAHSSRGLLLRAYLYRLQSRTCGGLDRQTRRRLDELAIRFDQDKTFTPAATARLKSGSVLVRDWNGKRYAVTVTETGFLYDGTAYDSLSAIATLITGVKWSGPRFFRLTAFEAKSP
jgi:hypothetical protein